MAQLPEIPPVEKLLDMCCRYGVATVSTDGHKLEITFFQGRKTLEVTPVSPPVKEPAVVPVQVQQAATGQDEAEPVHPLDLILHAPKFEAVADPEAK